MWPGALGGGLTVNNSFQGGGNYTGNLVQGAGGTIGAGGNGTVGTLALNGNLTLNAGTLRFDLSSTGLSGNDQITSSGTVTLNATNDVNLTALGGAFDTSTPYTLITSSALVGNQNNFRVAGPLAQSRYAFAFDTDQHAEFGKARHQRRGRRQPHVGWRWFGQCLEHGGVQLEQWRSQQVFQSG
jgi:hypothetical protein